MLRPSCFAVRIMSPISAAMLILAVQGNEAVKPLGVFG